MAALANRINPWDLRNTLFVRDVVSPRVDWLETPEAHVFKADLPGVKKEDIKVEVEEGNVLRISGAGSQEDVKETDKWHRIERSRTGFVRRFRLPDNVDLNNVTASVEDGVLQVTVPKIQPNKPQHRLINVEWGRSKL